MKYEERIAICKSCPRYWAEFGTCKECGCLIFAKARIPIFHCPLKKW